MKKELVVQVFLIIAALMIVLFAWFFLQTDDPVLIQDEALAEWLDLQEYSGSGPSPGVDPLVRMTPVPGSETEY